MTPVKTLKVTVIALGPVKILAGFSLVLFLMMSVWSWWKSLSSQENILIVSVISCSDSAVVPINPVRGHTPTDTGLLWVLEWSWSDNDLPDTDFRCWDSPFNKKIENIWTTSENRLCCYNTETLPVDWLYQSCRQWRHSRLHHDQHCWHQWRECVDLTRRHNTISHSPRLLGCCCTVDNIQQCLQQSHCPQYEDTDDDWQRYCLQLNHRIRKQIVDLSS